MKSLPKILCTTVVRAVKEGESHGGLFMIDLETEKVTTVYNYNDSSVDFSGRGSGRGLRGIAFDRDKVYVAGSSELFVFDNSWNQITSFKNDYLDLCHEICLYNSLLYLTSTSYDSILVFDTKKEKFVSAFQFSFNNYRKIRALRFLNHIFFKISGIRPLLVDEKIKVRAFNPDACNEVGRTNTLHLNHVFIRDKKICFSGLKLSSIQEFDFQKTRKAVNIPGGTHNAVIRDQDTIMMNNTRKDEVLVKNQRTKEIHRWKVPKYPDHELIHTDIPGFHARQGFARGLAFFEHYLIGGSSPATISVYNMQTKEVIKSINFSKDIRVTIHGLEVIPPHFDL